MLVNMHESKTNLSKLIKRALDGEEILIAINGEPKVKLTPVKRMRKKRIPGTAKGKGRVPNSFFEPLPDDVMRYFAP
jgi:prevent-host-death family protein